MKLSDFILIALISLLAIHLHAQTPPTWGGNPRYTVKVKMQNNDPAVNWTFTYYYDWNLKAERYQHEAPQEDEACLLPTTSFSKGGVPCEVIFATDGWFYITYPSHNFCCKCSKSFGSISYDWLKDNSTYVGIETVQGRSVTHWTKQGLYLNHYYSTVDKQLPVKFFQIKKGNPKSWTFDLNTYNTGPIDPSRFAAPCSNLCLGTCRILAGDWGQNLQKE